MTGYAFADTDRYEGTGSKRSRGSSTATQSFNNGMNFDLFDDDDDADFNRSAPVSSNRYTRETTVAPKKPRVIEPVIVVEQHVTARNQNVYDATSWHQIQTIDRQLQHITLDDVAIPRDLSGPPNTTQVYVIEEGNNTVPKESRIREHLRIGGRLLASEHDRPPGIFATEPPPPPPPPDESSSIVFGIPKPRLVQQTSKLRHGLLNEVKTLHRHLRGETLSEKYGRSPYEIQVRQGRLRLEKFRQILDCFTYARTPQQIQIHSCILKITAQFIMCEDFRAESQDLLREWNLTRHCFAALFMAGRRGGKTESGTQANAALLYLSDYGIHAAAFTTQQGISNLFIASTMRNLVQICEAEKVDQKRKIIRSSTSQLVVIKYAHHNTNISHAQLYAAGNYNMIVGLAANIGGQKGRKVNIANLDEASRIPLLIINESVAPHVTMGSVVIATSTTLGKDDPFTSMFNSEDPDAKQLVLRVQFKLLCDDCAEKDLNPLQCKHLDHLSTPWQNPDYRVRARVLMNGNKMMMLREIFGVPINDNEQIISSVMLDDFFNATRFNLTEHFAPNDLYTYGNSQEELVIYSFVDPGGYSRTHDSETSVCSIVWVNDQVVIVGGAACNLANMDNARDFFPSYFNRFKEIPLYQNAQHIIAVENNYGGSLTADNLFEQIQNVQREAIDISEHRPKVGVETKNQMKCDACVNLIDKIYRKKISIAMEPDFVCIDTARIAAANNLANANTRKGIQSHSLNTTTIEEGEVPYVRYWKGLREQMSRVRRVQAGARTWRYTGKGPSGSGQRDDDWMALILACYWSQQYVARILVHHDAQRAYERAFFSDYENMNSYY